MLYAGVLHLKTIPQAIFVVDIRKEASAIAEAARVGIPVVAIVDTNADPTPIDYIIPANDDAVGSIQYVVNIVADAYHEGKDAREKEVEEMKKEELKAKEQEAAERLQAAEQKMKEQKAA
jgi:small subunit ribosomal protein S2